MISPSISIILPVYNGALYLAQAVQSILDQDLRDFELLILNDGSTDNSKEVAESFSDPRIRFVHSDQNCGLVANLNKGIELARGRYIARMDQDDVSRPERMKVQMEFMEAHPEVVLCGAAASGIGMKDMHMPEGHTEILLRLLEYNAFIHSTVMIRKEALDRNDLWYDEEFRSAEDYHMWARMAATGKTANLSEKLIEYRAHPEQISQKDNSTQTKSADKVRCLLASQIIGRELSSEEKIVHKKLILGIGPEIQPDQLAAWAKQLKLGNLRTEMYPQKDLQQWLNTKLRRELHRYFLWEPASPGMLRRFFLAGNNHFKHFSLPEQFSIVKRSLIRKTNK